MGLRRAGETTDKTKTVRTVKGMPLASTLVLSKASSIPYAVAISLVLSPMMGKDTLLPEISSMSLTHLFAQTEEEKGQGASFPRIDRHRPKL